MITKEQIQLRLETLKKEQADAQIQYIQLGKNIDAYSGAIEDCQFWLDEFVVQEQEEKESKKGEE